MKDFLKFAVLTDIHLTEMGERNRERLALDSVRIFNETLEDAESLNPDFIFYTGDLFEARHFGLPHLDLAKRTLANTRVPWFVLMGNHDARYKTTQDGYDRDSFIRAFSGHGPSDARLYWSHEAPDSPFIFVGINTSQNFTSMGEVDAEQLAWLQSTLKRHSDRFVIAFMHHPAIPFDPILENNPELAIYVLKNHEEVRKLLLAHPCVKLVVSGHNHTRRHKDVSGLHFVGCPSINSWPNMYTIFQISPKAVSFSFHRIRDQAKVQEAYAGIIHPESTWLKGFSSGSDVAAYFSAKPDISAFAPR